MMLKLEMSQVDNKGKKRSEKSFLISRERLIFEIETFKKQGWVSNNTYFLDSSIKIDMKGKNYGVNVTWVGFAKPI